MDKPAVDKVEGVPPAIAIDQTNPVRNSRSTVGTMTELNDHLKLLFARAAQLFDRQTALPVRTTRRRPSTPNCSSAARPRATRALCSPSGGAAGQYLGRAVEQWLSASGFTKVQAEREWSAR
jgi:excinuclease ABC subunit A